jgi:hypothetical protein
VFKICEAAGRQEVMICETCHGAGIILERSTAIQPPEPRPCPECAGSGIGHCCDGLAEQAVNEVRTDNSEFVPANRQ